MSSNTGSITVETFLFEEIIGRRKSHFLEEGRKTIYFIMMIFGKGVLAYFGLWNKCYIIECVFEYFSHNVK
jgi:hypothetical protein